jgi:tetratricopeptide (TPR) repeat protein
MPANRLIHLRHVGSQSDPTNQNSFAVRRANRYGGQVQRSTLVALAAAAIIAAQVPARAQDHEGAYQEAQRLLRADQADAARGAAEPLASSGDETWQLIGRSLQALASGDVDAARGTAQQAVERNGDSAWTHFQLGFVAYRQNDFPTAASECERATQINGDLAYAHYFAGLAFQRERNSAKAGDHLNTFLRLAPDAPERQAVLAIVRTLG